MAIQIFHRTILPLENSSSIPPPFDGISIYRGILTGYNDAFIINQAKRKELMAADPRSTEILRPIIRGRDIARYRANWAGLWLISTFPSANLNIEDYPAIKRHLLSFGRDRLEQSGRPISGGRRSRKYTPHAWYEMQDSCAYHDEFQRPKLIWMHMTPYGRFALVGPNIICNQKCFMITGENLEYLCGILNSSIVSWYMKHTAVTTGMGLIQWDKFTVECIPLVQAEHLTIDHFGNLLKSMLTAIESRDDQKMTAYQRIIDNNVFDIYGLTEIEKNAVLRKCPLDVNARH